MTPDAGKAHTMERGWIWIAEKEEGLSLTIRADSIIMIKPIWDETRDTCTGCHLHLSSGLIQSTLAMPHEVEDAIKEALA